MLYNLKKSLVISSVVFALSSCNTPPTYKDLKSFERYDLFYKIVENDDAMALDKVLKEGFDINEVFFKCNTLILEGALKGSPRFLKHLIDLGADVNAKNCQGQNALHLASEPEKVEVLARAGADPNLKDWVNRNTPLHEAVKIGPTNPKVDTNLINTLIKYGADKTIKNKFGRTPVQEFRHRLKGLKRKVEAYNKLKPLKQHQIGLIKSYEDLEARAPKIIRILS